MTIKNKAVARNCKTPKEVYSEPKRLSKLGEWMRNNPNGIGLIVHDMRAVVR